MSWNSRTGKTGMSEHWRRPWTNFEARERMRTQAELRKLWAWDALAGVAFAVFTIAVFWGLAVIVDALRAAGWLW